MPTDDDSVLGYYEDPLDNTFLHIIGMGVEQFFCGILYTAPGASSAPRYFDAIRPQDRICTKCQAGLNHKLAASAMKSVPVFKDHHRRRRGD